MLVFFQCFFFTDTATTEIYTYLHTLSLHDALPILLAHQPQHLGERREHHGVVALGARLAPQRLAGGAGLGHRFHQRSEEHTSELQSLMRISYAGFCLKKKKRTNNIRNCSRSRRDPT